MPYQKNGIDIVLGEILLLEMSMKEGTRWLSHYYQDKKQDFSIKSLYKLKEKLLHTWDVMDLKEIDFINPFVEAISSNKTTESVKSAALTSVEKFISYGLIEDSVVENISAAVTKVVCRDPMHDSVILMKILQLLRTLMSSPLGVMQSNSSISQILQSCFILCFTECDEHLKETAAHCLQDMVQILFTQLQLSEDVDKPVLNKKLKVRAGITSFSREQKKTSDSKSLISGRSPNCIKKREGKHDISLSSSLAEEQKLNEGISIVSCDASVEDDVLIPQRASSPVLLLDTTREEHFIESAKTVILENTTQKNSKKDEEKTTLADISCDRQSAKIYRGLNSAILHVEIGMRSVSHSNDRAQEDKTLENPKEDIEIKSALKEAFAIDVQQNSSMEKREPMESTLNKSRFLESSSLANLDSLVEMFCSSGKEEDDSLSHHSLQKWEEYTNPNDMRFTSSTREKDDEVLHVPHKIICVQELFLFLISLCDPNETQNTEDSIRISLRLLIVALEVGAESIGSYDSLFSLVKDELCKNFISLLSSENLENFAANLQLAFLVFKSLRSHLKFQMEAYLVRLAALTTKSNSYDIPHEKREVALESLLRFWRIPGFVRELYVNYDCDLYCSNIFEALTDLFSENALPVLGVQNTNASCLSALLSVLNSIEFNDCHTETSESKCMGVSGNGNTSSLGEFRDKDHKFSSENIQIYEDLMAMKHKKGLLLSGSELFNFKPNLGIQVLQENGILSSPVNPQQVALFLKENPALNKDKIGVYISDRKNIKVLEFFVMSFDFTDLRIDEALRLFLETFRLPGEAVPISLVLEKFANHWFNCNGKPFENSDAAFTLAYAVIMLNVHQHNINAKTKSIPMTAEGFIRNLKGMNGVKDFDKEMLESIYNAIKKEEIVMPAEQTGIVRENYLWKVLLRRGASKDRIYIHPPVGLFDYELLILIHPKIVAALCLVFDQSDHPLTLELVISGFKNCAMMYEHYSMTNDFDSLVISLSKFTTLLSSFESMDILAVSLGENLKAQLATKTVFDLACYHGDILRDGWKNVLDCINILFKCKLLPKELVMADDFISPSGRISLVREETLCHMMEKPLLQSLYDYFTSSPDPVNVKNPSPKDEERIEKAKSCVLDCHIEQLVTESKFLHLDSLLELVKALIYASHGQGKTYDEDSTVFFLEFLLKVVIQNKDRVMGIWKEVYDHIFCLLMAASACNCGFMLERSVVGLLRLAKVLITMEDMRPVVLQSLQMLLLLKPHILYHVSRQIACGLFEILEASAENIYSDSDWSIIFILLECVGAGAHPPPIVGEAEKAASQTATNAEDNSYGPAVMDARVVGCQSACTSGSELYSCSKNTKSMQHENKPLLYISSKVSSSPVSPPNRQSGLNLLKMGKECERVPIQLHLIMSYQFSFVHKCELFSHDPYALVKSCDCLSFLVNNFSRITPNNFESCVHCLRTLTEAILKRSEERDARASNTYIYIDETRENTSHGKHYNSNKSKICSGYYSNSSSYKSDSEELLLSYHHAPIRLLALMYTLYERSIQILSGRSWVQKADPKGCSTPSMWSTAWCPLLQGIARLCCDHHYSVRKEAISYLQNSFMLHHLETLTANEWESCFKEILFPLLTKLMEPVPDQIPGILEEMQLKAVTLLSKVFLQQLFQFLSLPTFTDLWLTILEFMERYMHADESNLLYEAIPEILKNMLLVMDSAKVFSTADGYSLLWTFTWDRINTFLPSLKEELFYSHPS